MDTVSRMWRMFYYYTCNYACTKNDNRKLDKNRSSYLKTNTFNVATKEACVDVTKTRLQVPWF